MSRKPNLFSRAGTMLAILGAAGATAAAIEARRSPNRRDLEVLGIDPDSFKDVRLG